MLGELNPERMTWSEWAYAAGFNPRDGGAPERKAWRCGEDPSERRAQPAPIPAPLPFARTLLAGMDRRELRGVLRLLRYQDAHPSEPNPAAAQYELAGVTTGKVRAEYRRRGWRVPAPTPVERKLRWR